MTGTLEAIWIKRAHHGPMNAAPTVRVRAGRGIVGNANQGGKRQVTIIEQEVFEAIARALPDARPVMRRANLMVRGVRLEGTRDRILTIGGVRLHIRGETRPCYRMDEQCPGLTAALDPPWNGGVYAVVLDDGEIHVGDAVRLAPAAVTTPEGP